MRKWLIFIGLISFAVHSQQGKDLPKKAVVDMQSPSVKKLKKDFVENLETNPDSAVIKGIQLYNLSRKSNNISQISYAAGGLGLAYHFKKDFEKAIYFCKLAIKIQHSTKSQKMLPIFHRSLGIIYYDIGQMNRALQQFNLGLKYVEKGNPQHCLLLNNMGFLYAKTKEYKKAISYFEECIRYTLASDDHTYLKTYYETLSSLQMYIDPEEAKKTLDLGAQIQGGNINEIENSYTLSYATYYLKKKRYGEAKSYATKALKISFKNEKYHQTISAYLILAEINLALSQYESARIYAEKALEVGKQNGMFLDLKEVTDLLLKIYEKQHKNELVFEVLKVNMTINDSINRNSFAEYEVRNVFENKILQDSVKSVNQRKITALHYDQHIDRQKMTIWAAVVMTFLLVILVIYVFKNYINKQRINRFISWQNSVLAQQKQEVQNHVSQLRSAVESARDFISYSKNQSTFAYINSAGKKLLQFPEFEKQHYAYADIFKENTLSFLEKAFKISNNVGFYSDEAIFELRNGNSFPVLFNVVCHKKEDGQIDQYSMIAHDITYLKDYQQKITLQNAQMQKANSELDRFVYSISHDLRAPLISVVGVLEIIENEFYLPDADFHFHLSMLRSGLIRTDDSIKSILDYSKNTRESIKVSPVSIAVIFDNVIEDFHVVSIQKNIEIIVEISEVIPFYSDAERIQTLLHNLMDNAIKFQREAEKDKNITIRFASEADKATLTVTDNGIGIEPSARDKIFEMFYRGSNLSSGSGLGLYIVKQICDLLEAEIFVNTIHGKMTAFKIVFPNLNQNME